MRRSNLFQLGVHSFYEYQKAQREKQPEGQAPKSWMDILRPEKPEETPHTGVLRPEFRRQMVTLDANQYWDVPAIWNYVNEIRHAPYYRGGPFVVDGVTLPNPNEEVQIGQLIEFFRIPASVYDRLSFEDTVIKVVLPFMEGLQESINSYKPYIIPGNIIFEKTPDGAVNLAYYDR